MTREDQTIIDMEPGETYHREEEISFDPHSAASRESYNPATGALLGRVPVTKREGIEAAIRAAHEAQAIWAGYTPLQRAETLRTLQHILARDAEAIARLIAMEQGKPLAEAMTIEVLTVLSHLKWLVNEGVHHLHERQAPLYHPLFSTKRAQYHYDPLGVVAVVSPWNYPFVIPMVQILTALLAGNGVIFKPSPYTPLVGQKIAELGRQAGIPAGLLGVIQIEDEDAPYLTGHAQIDKIIFTGSLEIGREVMASAAQVPTPVILELGAKDLAIVAADANLDRAVTGVVWYAMANSGQSCASIERAYVHTSVYDAFIERAVEMVRGLKVGEGIETGVEFGPLSNEQQLQLVEAHIDDAREKGAHVPTGGYRLNRPGLYYAPTIVTDVTPEMRLVQEETFGPVLTVTRIDSLEEAVEAANRSAASLIASIWTDDEHQALDLARRLPAAAVNVNDHAFNYAEPGSAWGGLKESGFGHVHGLPGLMEMVNVKFVSTDMRRGTLEPWWYPYDEQLSHFLRNATRFLYGSPHRRIWALISLLLNPRTWQRLNLFKMLAAIRRWL